MTIIVYKCDTCKRTIEKVQTPYGFERIDRCVITQGCKGKLYQIKVHPDYIRASIPDDVSGLSNWSQRKLLYNHIQPISRKVWTIQHNLQGAPSVSVFVDRPTFKRGSAHKEQILPDLIEYVSDNVIKLTFDQPRSGIAQLINRQTNSSYISTETVQLTNTTQVTNKGELTIATKVNTDKNTPIIGVYVQYTINSGSPVESVYPADSQPAASSAWADYGKVIIKGQQYNIRSFNILNTEMVTGIINNGATVQFTGVDWYSQPPTTSTIESTQMLILLANAPYQTVDKITDKFIDISNLGQFSMVYNQGELLASPNTIQTTYPPIRTV